MPDSVAPRCCPASSQAIDRCVSWLLFNMATCMLWACVLVWRADRPCVRVTSPLRKGERPDTGVRGGGRTFRTWWRPRRRSRSARRPSARRRPRARSPRRRSSSERRRPRAAAHRPGRRVLRGRGAGAHVLRQHGANARVLRRHRARAPAWQLFSLWRGMAVQAHASPPGTVDVHPLVTWRVLRCAPAAGWT